MNLSGSSSSLTSDASTKTGTVSLRSFGIGGALLHKRVLQMTRQHDREMDENPERKRQETEAVQKGWSLSEERRGRLQQPNRQRVLTDAGVTLMRARDGSPTQKDREGHLGFSSGPQLKPAPPEPQVLRPKPQSEIPFRKRLKSPFRVLRERSQSRERLHPNSEQGAQRTCQDETKEQAEQKASRSFSPAHFLCLCRNRHARRKTV